MNNNNNEQQESMKPIWYFVGWMLALIGGLIVLAGILNLFKKLPDTSVVESLHPDLWWGAIITLTGIFYIFWNHKKIRL